MDTFNEIFIIGKYMILKYLKFGIVENINL